MPRRIHARADDGGRNRIVLWVRSQRLSWRRESGCVASRLLVRGLLAECAAGREKQFVGGQERNSPEGWIWFSGSVQRAPRCGAEKSKECGRTGTGRCSFGGNDGTP